MIKRLEGHKSAKALVTVYEETGEMKLTSYYTDVIWVQDYGDGIFGFMCTGLYSNTTRKHISWFLQEYFPWVEYQTIKGIAGKGELILHRP